MLRMELPILSSESPVLVAKERFLQEFKRQRADQDGNGYRDGIQQEIINQGRGRLQVFQNVDSEYDSNHMVEVKAVGDFTQVADPAVFQVNNRLWVSGYVQNEEPEQ